MEPDKEGASAATDRRAFLATAGKFALVTPPAMTMLLSTTLASPAIAASGRGSYQGDSGGQGGQGGQGDQGDQSDEGDLGGGGDQDDPVSSGGWRHPGKQAYQDDAGDHGKHHKHDNWFGRQWDLWWGKRAG